MMGAEDRAEVDAAIRQCALLTEAQRRAKARVAAVGVWSWDDAVGKDTDVSRTTSMAREEILKPMYRKFVAEEMVLLGQEVTSNGATGMKRSRDSEVEPTSKRQK